MFDQLEQLSRRPQPFSVSTTRTLWTDEHISAQMLACHLDPQSDLASRNAAFVARSVDWIVSELGVGPRTRLIDFGCGPGLYANALARRGAVVTGLDFSPRSLGHARGAARAEDLSVRYVEGDYLEYQTDERFDVILLIFCDFCPLAPAQRHRLLGTFHTLLRPEGRLLLDVCALPALARREETAGYSAAPTGGFWSADPYYCFLNAFTYAEEQVSLDQYTIIERQRTRTIYNWLQYFTPEGLEKELAEAGLRVAGLYGDVAGAAYDAAGDQFAVLARRE